MTTPQSAETSVEWRAKRRAKLLAHSCRSAGVGAFCAWAVVVDRAVAGADVSVARWLAVFAVAAVSWFLVGGGSGFLWSYLPELPPKK